LSVNAPSGQDSFAIGSSTATYFIVNKNGNVGIGTTSPYAKLSINDTSGSLTPFYIESNVNNYSQFNIRNINNGNTASTDFVATSNIGTESTYYVNLGINGSGYTQAGQNSENALDAYLVSSDTALVLGTASSTNSIADIRFVTGGLASSSIKAIIKPSGNFGIGTTSPSRTLSVQGTLYVTGTTTVSEIRFTRSNIASSTAVANTLYDVNFIKAYVGVRGGASPAIGDSFNVSSITDGGVGTFTVNWQVPFKQNDYAIAGISNNVTDEGYVSVRGAAGTGTTVSSALITTTEDTGGAVDATYWSIMAVGQQ
jgi:hypothetical protein